MDQFREFVRSNYVDDELEYSGPHSVLDADDEC